MQIPGQIFRPSMIAVVVREGRALRKRIDEALLAIYADGTYADTYAKWFAHGK